VPGSELAPLPLTPDVVRPVRLAAPLPRYPASALGSGISGEIVLTTIIDRGGNILQAEVVRGLSKGFDEAALAAVRQWKFQPARRGGEPVAVIYPIIFRFGA
jgi:TonB family protein